jgi:hypothetical protein
MGELRRVTRTQILNVLFKSGRTEETPSVNGALVADVVVAVPQGHNHYFAFSI